MAQRCGLCGKTEKQHGGKACVDAGLQLAMQAVRPEPSRKPEGEEHTPRWEPCSAYSESTMCQDYCRNCGCRQDTHPEFAERKPEGDAGQKRISLGCFAAECADVKGPHLCHNPSHCDCECHQLAATRAKVERELLEDLRHRANLLDEASQWPIGAGRQEFLADQAKALRAAIAKYREAK